ncbi:hypothetical protein BaRGS_00032271 [Batillaria attramentaria]|uniref:Uncharacterized protein n=1 Tax=Batillaria attramentaria TaxID=370345 RepID=A0ABD0JP04_9CAEN
MEAKRKPSFPAHFSGDSILVYFDSTKMQISTKVSSTQLQISTTIIQLSVSAQITARAPREDNQYSNSQPTAQIGEIFSTKLVLPLPAKTVERTRQTAAGRSL